MSADQASSLPARQRSISRLSDQRSNSAARRLGEAFITHAGYTINAMPSILRTSHVRYDRERPARRQCCITAQRHYQSYAARLAPAPAFPMDFTKRDHGIGIKTTIF